MSNELLKQLNQIKVKFECTLSKIFGANTEQQSIMKTQTLCKMNFSVTFVSHYLFYHLKRSQFDPI